MLYKTRKIYDGFYNSSNNLRGIAHWIEGYYREKFNKEPVMTGSLRSMEKHIELYSKQINPKTQKLYTVEEIKAKGTVHMANPLRGMDLRSRILTEEQNRKLVDDTNVEWVYDSARPYLKCAQLHKVGDNAFHLHIQVHPNTVRRTNES